jgi:MFS family permease
LLPGVFILPFFLFSATAGQIADKYEKSRIIRIVKLFEICIMLFAGTGFYLDNILLLAIALFMMGMHSTLFGPVKYAYLPQHLNSNELVGGNGLLEMGSFVAILLGQVLGAWLGMLPNHALLTSITVIALAVIGYSTSRNVPNSPAGATNLVINWNPFTETYRNLKQIWGQQPLWIAIIGISWFWFYGATLLAQFPNFAKHTLHGDESIFILLLTVFSLGIGIGSLLCEKLSKHKVETGLIVFGAIGLVLFGGDLYASGVKIEQTFKLNDSILNFQTFLNHLSNWRLLLDIALIGIFGGIYIVPLYAFLQTQAEAGFQSRVIAANNIMNAIFMVASAGFSLWIFNLGFDIPQLFLITALLSLIVTIYLCWRNPNYLKRFFHLINVKN